MQYLIGRAHQPAVITKTDLEAVHVYFFRDKTDAEISLKPLDFQLRVALPDIFAACERAGGSGCASLDVMLVPLPRRQPNEGDVMCALETSLRHAAAARRSRVREQERLGSVRTELRAAAVLRAAAASANTDLRASSAAVLVSAAACCSKSWVSAATPWSASVVAAAVCTPSGSA